MLDLECDLRRPHANMNMNDQFTSAGRRPTVSVCIPTYNRAKLLRQAIGSVLEQTFQDFEIIVYDNASTDDTAAVAESFSEERIRYFRNTRNLGHRENWKRCFRAARGDYIAAL